MTGHSWKARPVLSRAIRLGVLVAPIGVSVAVAATTAALLPRPTSVGGAIAWWILFLAALGVPLMLSTRAATRLLPLAALLDLTLVFPDKAPTRLEVARKAGRTRDLKEKLKHALDGDEANEAAILVLALITSLGDHDRRTRGHSERVRAFTDMLADELKLPPLDRQKLRWAALLHDVGKLEVEAEILNKPDKPSTEEWTVLHAHPSAGMRLLGPLGAWLGAWAGAIEEHHERYDGTGYPRGLEGHDISLGGRIVAIADSYEVMTAARAYKRPLSPETARTELVRCAGSHFDPRLVKAFLGISVGRLWWVIGAGALLAQLPVLSGLSYRGIAQRFGRSVTAAAGAVATTGVLVAGGLVDLPGGPAARSGEAQVAAPRGDSASSPATLSAAGADQEPSTHPQSAAIGQAEAPEEARNGPPGVDDDPRGEGSAPNGPVEPDDEDPDDPGHEEDPAGFSATGRVVAPAAVYPTASSVTESDFRRTCAVPASQGTDAWVFDLPQQATGVRVRLRASATAGQVSVLVRAYSSRCEPLGSRSGPFDGATFSPATSFVVAIPTATVATTVTLEAAG